MGHLNNSSVLRVGLVEIKYYFNTSLIEKAEGENPSGEDDLRFLCGAVNYYCVFRASWDFASASDPPVAYNASRPQLN